MSKTLAPRLQPTQGAPSWESTRPAHSCPDSREEPALFLAWRSEPATPAHQVRRAVQATRVHSTQKPDLDKLSSPNALAAPQLQARGCPCAPSGGRGDPKTSTKASHPAEWGFLSTLAKAVPFCPHPAGPHNTINTQPAVPTRKGTMPGSCRAECPQVPGGPGTPSLPG